MIPSSPWYDYARSLWPGWAKRTRSYIWSDLLGILAQSMSDAAKNAVEYAVDLDAMHGETLDLYGETWSMPRARAENDDNYRIFLRTAASKWYNLGTNLGYKPLIDRYGEGTYTILTGGPLSGYPLSPGHRWGEIRIMANAADHPFSQSFNLSNTSSRTLGDGRLLGVDQDQKMLNLLGAAKRYKPYHCDLYGIFLAKTGVFNPNHPSTWNQSERDRHIRIHVDARHPEID